MISISIKKLKQVLLASLIILTSCIIENIYFTPKKEIKIVSYNIHSGLNKDMFPTLFDIIDFLRVADADIICLQEVNESAKVGFQVSSFKEELKMNSYFGANVINFGRNYGLATYSKFPIKEENHVHLESGNKEQRGFIHTSLDVGSKRLDIINIHLGLGEDQRQAQIVQLKNYIKSIQSEYYIVAGDFNEGNLELDESVLVDIAKKLNKHNTLTFATGIDRIDYIFASPNIEVVEYDVPIKTMSDHYPIVARIKI